jgi:porphobilinogen deaminase
MSASVIGSRGSDLALWQSRTVLAALGQPAGQGDPIEAHWHPDITVIATRGDLDQSPLLVGKLEKGFFTRELELALQNSPTQGDHNIYAAKLDKLRALRAQ